jgi:hypothetical protein
MEPRKDKYINRRERVLGFLYVSLLFGAFSGVCAWSLFQRDDNRHLFSYKGSAVSKMERLSEFRQAQRQYQPRIDTLCARIDRYSPGVIASYEENEVNILIKEVGDVYEQHSYDRRYKVFRHYADFCRMWLNDKKELWGLQENIRAFKSNLEACEIGLQKKADELKGNNKRK